jgi:phosphoglycolate phosphatase
LSTAKSAPRYKYVLFDLDGTLLDSAKDITHALNQLRAKYNLLPLPYEEIRPVVSLGSPGLLKLCFGITVGDPQYAALRQEFFQYYERYLSDHSHLFEGALDLLDALEKSGVKWGIVTNKITQHTKSILKLLNLSERVNTLVCADTLANKKPHPEPMLFACTQLGCKPDETIYIGDAKNDVVAAHAAGMPAVVAAWGYIPNNVDPTSEWEAEFTFSSVRELQQFVLP